MHALKKYFPVAQKNINIITIIFPFLFLYILVICRLRVVFQGLPAPGQYNKSLIKSLFLSFHGNFIIGCKFGLPPWPGERVMLKYDSFYYHLI